jgi:hypothetical protein
MIKEIHEMGNIDIPTPFGIVIQHSRFNPRYWGKTEVVILDFVPGNNGSVGTMLCNENDIKFKINNNVYSSISQNDGREYYMAAYRIAKKDFERFMLSVVGELPCYAALHGYTDYEPMLREIKGGAFENVTEGDKE